MLRGRQELRRLWIDAICINQASLKEKNQQVPMMADIYGGAARVLVWLELGAQDESRVRRAAQLFRRTGSLYRER